MALEVNFVRLKSISLGDGIPERMTRLKRLRCDARIGVCKTTTSLQAAAALVTVK
jgi:hypothetical protein